MMVLFVLVAMLYLIAKVSDVAASIVADILVGDIGPARPKGFVVMKKTAEATVSKEEASKVEEEVALLYLPVLYKKPSVRVRATLAEKPRVRVKALISEKPRMKVTATLDDDTVQKGRDEEIKPSSGVKVLPKVKKAPKKKTPAKGKAKRGKNSKKSSSQGKGVQLRLNPSLFEGNTIMVAPS